MRKATSTARGWWRSTSTRGEDRHDFSEASRSRGCAVWMRLVVSVSSSMLRRGIMIAARMPPMTNRIRQPHSCIASGVSMLANNAPRPTASSEPISLFAAAHEVARPRRPGVADSMRYTMVPVYSAPTENPATQRSTTIPMPPQIPAVSIPGSIAVPNIETEISPAEMKSAARRPTRSPRWPNTIAPRGRNRKPAAPTPSVSSSESGRSPKNSRVRIVAT